MMDLDLMRESLSSLCLLSGQLCDKYPRECSGCLEALWVRDYDMIYDMLYDMIYDTIYDNITAAMQHAGGILSRVRNTLRGQCIDVVSFVTERASNLQTAEPA